MSLKLAHETEHSRNSSRNAGRETPGEKQLLAVTSSNN